ncbi:MAG: hypothetical protein JWQ53_2828 [Klenkia sp.]|nr:hypothetical protein [Klenkia sp.]
MSAVEVLLVWTGLAVLALLVVVAAARSGRVEDEGRGRREEAPAAPEFDPA